MKKGRRLVLVPVFDLIQHKISLCTKDLFSVRISRAISDVIDMLDVRLFQLPAMFLAGLHSVVRRGPARAGSSVEPQSEDPFAPGM
jgi:hypothetical protein